MQTIQLNLIIGGLLLLLFPQLGRTLVLWLINFCSSLTSDNLKKDKLIIRLMHIRILGILNLVIALII